MDTHITQIYGSPESEFAYILTTFPIVAEGVKAAALTAYRAAASGEIK